MMDDDGNNSDEEDFEYTDEEPEEDDIAVALENEYYNAKGLRESDMSEAADAFGKVITMEQDALLANKPDDDDGNANDKLMMFGPWSFKALKQLVKVRLRTGELDQARDSYRRMLDGISSPHCDGVSPNAIEKGIQAMLECVSSSRQKDNERLRQIFAKAMRVESGIPHPRTLALI